MQSNLLSATVIADDCMTADAYATAFMVMGLEKTIQFLGRSEKLQAYLVYSDDSGNLRSYRSEGLRRNFVE